MSDFNEELNSLVKMFAVHQNGAYTIPEQQAQLQKIESCAMTLFTHHMVKEGFKAESINKQYKALARWFHTDKLIDTTPERKWLDAALSGPGQEGGAFKLIRHVHQELLKSNESNFFNVSGMDELLGLLKTRKEKAATLTQQTLIQSIIDVMQSAQAYHTGVSSDNASLIKGVLHGLPYISGGICVGFYVKELALLYASIYLLSTGGQWLAHSSETRWKMLGRQMQTFSTRLNNAVLALLSSLARLNFVSLHHIKCIGSGMGTALYHYLVPAIEEKPALEKTNPSVLDHGEHHVASGDNALILAPQHLFGGKEFTSLEVKLIALPLEHYKTKQEKQYWGTWRQGHTKNKKLTEAVTQLQHLDKETLGAEKFKKIEAHLRAVADNTLFKNPSSNASKALANAINLAKQWASDPFPLAVNPPLMIEHHPKTEKADKEEDRSWFNSEYSF